MSRPTTLRVLYNNMLWTHLLPSPFRFYHCYGWEHSSPYRNPVYWSSRSQKKTLWSLLYAAPTVYQLQGRSWYSVLRLSSLPEKDWYMPYAFTAAPKHIQCITTTTLQTCYSIAASDTATDPYLPAPYLPEPLSSLYQYTPLPVHHQHP